MPDLPPPLPATEVAMAMPPQELAGPLLAYLLKEYDRGSLHRPNVIGRLRDIAGRDVATCLSEAFAWLERECLVVHPVDGNEAGVFVLSRAGRDVAQPDAFERYRQASRLPRGMLHPTIAAKAWGLFLTGEYDTAVFAAFKAVEVAVGEKSGCEGTGKRLMQAAFHREDGPLSDLTASIDERVAMEFLFVGANGTARNPAGHRNIVYSGPDEAAELLMLASHLMRIVDTRGQ